MLWQKMTKKHLKKGAGWVKRKYRRNIGGNTWTFATPEGPEQQVLRWMRQYSFNLPGVERRRGK
jgi:hypothetical protein